MSKKNDKLENQERYLSADDEDGHCFTLKAGKEWRSRLTTALQEHYDGDIFVEAEDFSKMEVMERYFKLKVTVTRDGEDPFEIFVFIETTHLY